MEDKECNNSCEDDTTSESESSVSDGEKTCVEESFEVLFCASGKHPTHKLGMREQMEGGSGGGGGVTLILSVGEGRGVNVNFCLVRGGCDLILSRILPISQPPHPDNYCTVPNIKTGSDACFDS